VLGSWKRSPDIVVPAQVPASSGYIDDSTLHEPTLWVSSPLKGADGAALGSVVAQFTTADLQARTEAIFRLAMAVLFGCIVATVALASRLHRLVTTPLQALADTASRVRVSRDYSIRAAHLTNDETQVVADAFNEMLVGIQQRDTELENHRKNLESLVEQRTRALDLRNQSMRIVLDNVNQGIVTLDRNGVLDPERSRAFDAWLGAPKSEQLHEHLSSIDPKCGDWFRLGLDMVWEDMLPLSVSLSQMPGTLVDGQSHFRIQYQPVYIAGREGEDTADAVAKLLVLFADVTADVQREKIEQGQREAFHIFQRLMSDRSGITDFADEAIAIVEKLGEPTTSREEVLRAVHTLKGNAGLFDLPSIVSICHSLEDRMIDDGGTMSDAERAELSTRVHGVVEQVRNLMGQRKGVLDIAEDDIKQLSEAVAAKAPPEMLLALIATWSWQPAQPRFERFAEQAKTLATRLGRGDITVNVKAGDVRLPPERLRSFFAAFAHVVRNAVDHGLETPDDRTAAGKSAAGTIELGIAEVGNEYVITVVDDGRGIDWERVRQKCRASGLPSATQADLQEALFADGMSTKADVSETSGRGVGMSVVNATVNELGGRIEIDTTAGKGTTWRFRIPAPTGVGRARLAA
jgi:two-component system chemotaxis sensor kinase CheA